MKSYVEQMLEAYHCTTAEEYRNALKEIVQAIALCGLSRGQFFQKAAFYGGTALRIFYGLDRFSEDMDFSLIEPDPAFQIDEYFPYVKNELGASGFEMAVGRKEKKLPGAVQSAFIKGNTWVQIIRVLPAQQISGIHKDEVMKIKFEIDTDPPAGAVCERKYGLQPMPYSVRLYSLPSLFAGKLHAVLCRNWRQRVKGRDFYDYVWYLSRQTPVNIEHLQKRLEQTGNWEPDRKLTAEQLREMLKERFSHIDFEEAKRDVLPFIREPQKLELWSEEFFDSITEQLRAADVSVHV